MLTALSIKTPIIPLPIIHSGFIPSLHLFLYFSSAPTFSLLPYNVSLHFHTTILWSWLGKTENRVTFCKKLTVLHRATLIPKFQLGFTDQCPVLQKADFSKLA